MPSFVVKRVSFTKDGSRMGPAVVMITAPSAEAAKIEGANQLGCAPTQVTAEPYVGR
jgi:hypothetical protein